MDKVEPNANIFRNYYAIGTAIDAKFYTNSSMDGIPLMFPIQTI
jgi:hypothetical protein